MGSHALLSPSDAERWISCPAAIRMDKEVPEEPESPYAREGTAAHALGEIKASFHFGKITKAQFNRRKAEWAKEFETYAEDPEVYAEMEEHTDAYVALLEERVARVPGSEIYLEVRVDPGVPESGGTADAVIVSAVHVEAVDFKYGAGVAVSARGNPQLRLYALGALEEYDILDTVELVYITVHQPRMDHVLTDEMTPEALYEWRDNVVIPRALLALTDDAPFGPSEDACRWCPSSGRCRAQLESVFTDLPLDRKPDTLEPEEISDLLGRRAEIAQWLAAFEKAALDAMYTQGKVVPGYKIVRSGGQRGVRDTARFKETLLNEGFDEDEIMNPGKPKGIGDMEKLLGKERFKALLEDSGIVTKSEGREAIAPESDSRPAIQPNSEAARVFTLADEEDMLS